MTAIHQTTNSRSTDYTQYSSRGIPRRVADEAKRTTEACEQGCINNNNKNNNKYTIALS